MARSPRHYVTAVRLLTRLMLLIAVMLMPLGMTPVGASSPHGEPTAATVMNHCVGHGSGRAAKDSNGECAMACAAALPAADNVYSDAPPFVEQSVNLAAVERLVGLEPETVTPPPKRA